MWELVHDHSWFTRWWVIQIFINSYVTLNLTKPVLLLLSRCSSVWLCDPIDGSPPGSAIPGILQARTLEWAAISFSSAWKWKVKLQLLSRVQLLVTPWTTAYQAPQSMGFSRQEYWSGVPLFLNTRDVFFLEYRGWGLGDRNDMIDICNLFFIKSAYYFHNQKTVTTIIKDSQCFGELTVLWWAPNIMVLIYFLLHILFVYSFNKCSLRPCLHQTLGS